MVSYFWLLIGICALISLNTVSKFRLLTSSFVDDDKVRCLGACAQQTGQDKEQEQQWN